MGAGLSGLNGIGLEVSKHIWDIYIMWFGSTSAVSSRWENPAELPLKQSQHASAPTKSTAKPGIYLLLNSLLLEAQLHITITTFFTGVLCRSDSLEQAVIHRQSLWRVRSQTGRCGMSAAYLRTIAHPMPSVRLAISPLKTNGINSWRKVCTRTCWKVRQMSSFP